MSNASPLVEDTQSAPDIAAENDNKSIHSVSDDQLAPLKQRIKEFTVPHLGIAMREFSLAILGYFAIAATAIFAFKAASWGLFAACIIAGGFFLVKLFTIQHDCGHSSFFKKEIWNRRLGRFISLFTIVPFAGWKREHNIHHSVIANIDLHDVGEIHVLTVDQYKASHWLKKLQYRIYRNPLFLIFTTPLLYYFIRQRYPVSLQKHLVMSAVLNNLFIVVLYAGLSWALGWQAVLATLVGSVYVAGVLGVFLFYVQHQFEDMVWFETKDWTFEKAAIAGSSFVKLPWLINWLSGSIGYHHIHHYNSRVPSYKLKQAYAALPELRENKPLNIIAAIKALNLKLWSTQKQKMVGWKELKLAS